MGSISILVKPWIDVSIYREWKRMDGVRKMAPFSRGPLAINPPGQLIILLASDIAESTSWLNREM